jgi:hypothetical protein
MSRSRAIGSWIAIGSIALSTLLAGPALADADPVNGTIPTNGALVGAYVKPEKWDQAGVKSAITGLETSLGRKLDISHHFYRWDLTFPTWQETWDYASGRIPMMSWGPVSTAEVNSGMHDALIRQRAAGVKALGKPVLMRWFYEMEASEMAERAGTPAEYISAWRRIHDIFEAEGATNVQWVWCGIASRFRHGDSQEFYPGDDYVDWIAADGYNWAPAKPVAWTSFKDIFQWFYAWASQKDKPLMIAESGALEDSPGRKAQWITDAGTTLQSDYPKIKAWVYLDALASSFSGGSYDWRLNSSTSSLTSYRNVVQGAYFNQSGAGILPPAEATVPPPDDTTPPPDDTTPPPDDTTPPPNEDTGDGDAEVIPDGLITDGTTDSVGDDVYNETGTGQSRKKNTKPGRRAKFTITYQNDGAEQDVLQTEIRQRGKRSVRWRLRPLQGPTARALAPGETVELRLVARVRRNARPGTSVCMVTGMSSDGAVVDTVRAVVRIRR